MRQVYHDFIQKFVKMSIVRHDVKMFVMMSKIRESKSKVYRDIKGVMTLKTVSPISNVKYDSCSPLFEEYIGTNLTFIRCVVPELSTTMCFSQFW